MPIYSMKNLDTEEIFEVVMSNDEREQYLRDNTHIKQIFNKFPGVADPTRIGVTRHSDGFNDVLKKIKNSHHKSTIETR
jgi:hypothetical protein|tara:strand:- start:794 stop:1030 length:237 start_codon:yes stop_codon:yes gene_type:complete